jgi:V8-like Glu-specific endopeptidase
MKQDHAVRRVASAAAASVVLAVACPAQANLFSATGEDPRVELNRSVYPYSAIGFMETPRPVPVLERNGTKQSVITGTAFMVSPCYALTAYHVVFGNDPATDATALTHPVWISLGGKGRRFALNRLQATAVAWGDFHLDQSLDWALLKVTGCPGGRADVRWIPFEPKGAQLEARVAQVGGFDGQFVPFKMTGQIGCLLGRKVDAVTIRHFCASRPGMSGAPILVREKDQILRASAIVSREQDQSGATLTTSQVTRASLTNRANLAVIISTALGGNRFYPRVAADRAKGSVFPIATPPGQ